MRYKTNKKGEKTAILFDLKNKAIQELLEDTLDLLVVKNRLDDEKVDFFEEIDKILASKN